VIDVPIGIGIIGCGYAARHVHLPRLRYHASKFRIVACADMDTARVDAFSQEVLATPYHDTQSLLADERVELVLILTKPPSTHRDLTLAALAAGRHVVVEKPMAEDVAQCDEMIAAVGAGQILTVHQNRRWDIDFLTVQDAMGRECVGTPRLIRNEYTAGYDGSAYDWGIHIVDQTVCLSRGRRFVEVSATMAKPCGDTPRDSKGFFTARLRTDDGVLHDVGMLPVVQGNAYRPGMMLPRFVLIGTAGMLIQQWCQRPEDAFGSDVRFEGSTSETTPPGDPLFVKAELAVPDFHARLYAAVRDGGEVPVTAVSARRSVALWHAIYESGARGCMMAIDV